MSSFSDTWGSEPAGRLNCGARCYVDGHGFGTVGYRRMAPPTYSTVEVYSVVLDSRRADLGYSGTIFPAAKVQGCTSDTQLMDLVLGGAVRS